MLYISIYHLAFIVKHGIPLRNEYYCVKHCLDVFEQNSFVNW